MKPRGVISLDFSGIYDEKKDVVIGQEAYDNLHYLQKHYVDSRAFLARLLKHGGINPATLDVVRGTVKHYAEQCTKRKLSIPGSHLCQFVDPNLKIKPNLGKGQPIRVPTHDKGRFEPWTEKALNFKKMGKKEKTTVKGEAKVTGSVGGKNKYEYPEGLTADQKKKLRVQWRKEAKDKV